MEDVGLAAVFQVPSLGQVTDDFGGSHGVVLNQPAEAGGRGDEHGVQAATVVNVPEPRVSGGDEGEVTVVVLVLANVHPLGPDRGHGHGGGSGENYDVFLDLFDDFFLYDYFFRYLFDDLFNYGDFLDDLFDYFLLHDHRFGRRGTPASHGEQ